MKRYAIKVGEIQLVSDKPISDTERRETIRELLTRDYSGPLTWTREGLQVRLNIVEP